MKWSDLTPDERRFLMLWREADRDTAADVFALLVNHQTHDVGETGNIVDLAAARKKKREASDE